MTDTVARQLAKKMKLENRLKPKLRRFFNQISSDVKSVWTATRSIPSLRSFNLELTAILRDHYRAVAKQFSTTTRDSLKFSNKPLILKQEENIDREIVTFINEHSQNQSDIILRTTERNLQNITAGIIRDANTRGIIVTTQEVGVEMQTQFNINSANRINRIAGTETQAVSETIKLLEAENLSAIINVMPGTQEMFKTWNTVLDEKTRLSHVEADRQKVPVNQPFRVQGQNLKIPGDTSLGATPDNVIECLHPDSIVQACDPVNLTRRLYQGDMFTIKTFCGNEITVTPNHPILTISGWKAARLIDESDDIITTTNVKSSKFCDFDINNVKATIEDIYNSVSVKAVTMGVGSCNMNFHGDISNHDVDIIFSDSLLRKTFKSFGVHIENNIRFKSSNLGKGFFSGKSLSNGPFFSCFGFPSGLVRFFSVFLSFFLSGLTHSKMHRFASCSGSNASLTQSIGDNISGDIEAFGNFFNRKIFSKFFNNNADLFITAKVIKTHKFAYSGYVYNMEDKESYYICNGIVNHNCRCTAVFNVEGEESPPLDIPRGLL